MLPGNLLDQSVFLKSYSAVNKILGVDNLILAKTPVPCRAIFLFKDKWLSHHPYISFLSRSVPFSGCLVVQAVLITCSSHKELSLKVFSVCFILTAQWNRRGLLTEYIEYFIHQSSVKHASGRTLSGGFTYLAQVDFLLL